MNIRKLDNLKIENANTVIKGFSNSNLNLRKCSSNIQLQGDWHQNLLSSSIDICLLRMSRLILNL